jgi:hypothetical protein
MSTNNTNSHEENSLDYQDDVAQSNATSLQAIKEMKETLQYEGTKISDLEQSGLQTINLLKVASPTVSGRIKFNVPLLDATPVNFVLESIGATYIKDNMYEIYGQEIATNENKWFNRTLKKGKHNSVELLKHLIAIDEKIDEKENSKSLFLAACHKLNSLQDKLQEAIANQVDDPEAKPSTDSTDANTTKDFKYEVSDAMKQTQTQNKGKIDWKLVREQLNNIPLDIILEHLGANSNEDGHRGKWKVDITGHNVQLTGNKWYDWNTQTGDKGAISLMAYHLAYRDNMPYVSDEEKWEVKKYASREMLKAFGKDYDLSEFTVDENNENYKKPFAMPHVIDFKINSVKQYLHEKRGLPMWVINKQVREGKLFAGFPSDWSENRNLNNPEKLSNNDVWATFLGVNGNAAEMRAIERIDKNAKILATGSAKESGGFLIKAEKEFNERTVVACEAAIDTMSYHSFYPGRIVTSCMGVNFKLAVNSAIEAVDNGYKFQLAFDNDLAGNEAAVRFRETIIGEIGEEEYNEHMQKGNIGYFDLGIKCLLNTIKRGGVFYLDVRNNDVGRTAATMFQEQLFKIVPRETVKELLKKGKIKYANVAPAYSLIRDVQKEATECVNLLLSSKPFYLVLKQGDDDEKDDVRIKREAFEDAFVEACGDKLEQFKKEGKVIYKKQAFAKDWNEFFLIMKKDPKIQQRLSAYEDKMDFYNTEVIEPPVLATTKKKKP